MGPDYDGDDDTGVPGAPLPPDDRLWRHPSEVREHGIPGRPLIAAPSRRVARAWPVAVVAGLTGAVLSIGILAVTGALAPSESDRRVVEKVAVTPLLASPVMPGDRGVAAIAQRVSPAIVRLDTSNGDGYRAAGSGVVFRSDGLALTSAHVVAGAQGIQAELTDGRYLRCELIGVDPLTDIALVRIDGDDLPVAVLGSAEGIEVGSVTIAIGSALGFEGAPSVTTGIISAVGRQVKVEGGEVLHGVLQTDAPIAPGSSGGALLDGSGAVVGITVAGASDAASGFGFAVPIDLARRVADGILAHGRMIHSWLGVEGRDHDSADGRRDGALVRAVAPDSPAALAGLQVDDVIDEVDGEPVDSISEVVVELREHAPGSTVTIGYWRGDHHAETTATLTERP